MSAPRNEKWTPEDERTHNEMIERRERVLTKRRAAINALVLQFEESSPESKAIFRYLAQWLEQNAERVRDALEPFDSHTRPAAEPELSVREPSNDVMDLYRSASLEFQTRFSNALFSRIRQQVGGIDPVCAPTNEQCHRVLDCIREILYLPGRADMETVEKIIQRHKNSFNER